MISRWDGNFRGGRDAVRKVQVQNKIRVTGGNCCRVVSTGWAEPGESTVTSALLTHLASLSEPKESHFTKIPGKKKYPTKNPNHKIKTVV